MIYLSLALRNAAYTGSPSMAYVNQGTIVDAERVLPMTPDGLWIKITTDCIRRLFGTAIGYIENDRINPNTLNSPPLQAAFLLVNKKNCTLCAIPKSCYLFKSLLTSRISLILISILEYNHNVFSAASLQSNVVGALPGGQLYAVDKVIQNEQGGYIDLS